MKEFKYWMTTIKMKGLEEVDVELNGNYDENDVVRLLGLKESNIEWYKMREVLPY